MLETLARVPVEVAYGSEFRYMHPVIDDSVALLAITQSGETVDTLVSMEAGRKLGASIWSIVNVIGSQAMRQADGYIGMQAGPEVGVASTKTFTASVVDQYMLALYLAELRGVITDEELCRYVLDLARLPGPGGPGAGKGRGVSGTGRAVAQVPRIFCSSAGASTIPSPWKVRSSSRKSATFTPRATRPGR